MFTKHLNFREDNIPRIFVLNAWCTEINYTTRTVALVAIIEASYSYILILFSICLPVTPIKAQNISIAVKEELFISLLPIEKRNIKSTKFD